MNNVELRNIYCLSYSSYFQSKQLRETIHRILIAYKKIYSQINHNQDTAAIRFETHRCALIRA